MSEDHSFTTFSNVSHKERKRAAIISLILGFILLCIKFYAYHVTNSKAIFSDALESIVNVVAGLITMIVLFISAIPADDDHPYGHGKIESMAATFEGGAILFAGILIIIESLQTLFHGTEVRDLNLGLILITIAGLANGILGYILVLQGKKHHSEALRSSGTHLMTDAYTTIGILLGLGIVKITGLSFIDPIIAAIFGGLLIFTGGKILYQSGNNLLDAHDEETIGVLNSLFEKNYRQGIIHIHFTRVIRSGTFHHVDCHMVVPEFWTVHMAHDFSNEFEQIIMDQYPVSGELNIHLDPCRKVYCENCELQNCPIRVKEFKLRHSFSIEELTSPTEKR